MIKKRFVIGKYLLYIDGYKIGFNDLSVLTASNSRYIEM